MLDNLSLRTKLFLIALVATVPSIILLVLLISEKNIAIDFARKEYVGNEYLRPVRAMQQSLITYQSQVRAGAAPEATAPTLAALDKAVKELQAVDSKHRNEMKLEGRFASLAERIGSLPDRVARLSPDVANDEISTVRGEVRRLFSYIGDASNLILDPDLDSYYAMDAVVLKVPALNDELPVSARLVDAAIRDGKLSETDRSLLQVSVGQLEALSQELDRNLHTGFDNNPSREFKTAVEPALEEYLAALGAYLSYVDKYVLAPGAKPQRADVEGHLSRVGTSGFALWDRTSQFLDRLLLARMDGFEARKLQALLLVGIVLFCSAVAVYAISGRLSERVGKLADFSREIASKPGEESRAQKQIEELVSEDEVGALAHTVSEMGQQIRRYVAELEAGRARLEEYNQTLEARVEARTREIQEKNAELEKALLQVREAQNRLVTQEKLASLGALTAGIAHEIKNPLNFVNNFAQLSADLIREMQELTEKVSPKLDKNDAADFEDILGMLLQNVEKINEHGQRADNIVKGMLAHSRGKAGERVPTDLNALLTEYTKLAYHGLRAQDNTFNVTLEFQLDSAVGKIPLVPQDLSRAVLNIVNNGCYAAHERRKKEGAAFAPTLTVASKVAGDRVEVRIRDNGTGISKDKIQKIFEPFFTTKPTGQGTGLGLSMTYDIVVQQHQGELRVESEEGQFAEFIITLPRA